MESEENIPKKLEVPPHNFQILDAFKMTLPEWIREQLEVQLGHKVEKGGMVTMKVLGYTPPAKKGSQEL